MAGAALSSPSLPALSPCPSQGRLPPLSLHPRTRGPRLSPDILKSPGGGRGGRSRPPWGQYAGQSGVGDPKAPTRPCPRSAAANMSGRGRVAAKEKPPRIPPPPGPPASFPSPPRGRGNRTKTKPEPKQDGRGQIPLPRKPRAKPPAGGPCGPGRGRMPYGAKMEGDRMAGYASLASPAFPCPSEPLPGQQGQATPRGGKLAGPRRGPRPGVQVRGVPLGRGVGG